MIDSDAIRLLRDAQYSALDEIVERGINIGRAIQRGECYISKYPSIFDAVDAYYVSRRAAEVAEREGS